MEPAGDGKKVAWYKTWYENRFLVVLASIFLFPVGMYGLWKSSQFKRWAELRIKGQAWRCIWVLWAGAFFVSPFLPKEPVKPVNQAQQTIPVKKAVEQNVKAVPVKKTAEEIQQAIQVQQAAEKTQQAVQAQQDSEKIKQEQKIKREKEIAKLFNPWNGSCYKLNEAIIERMNDPGSFKHVKTVYVDMGSFLLVKTFFRGKNGFGALTLNSVEAKVDMKGNVEILEQGK